jgi:hypothetical protein
MPAVTSTPLTLNFLTSSPTNPAWNGIHYGEKTADGAWSATYSANQPSEATRILYVKHADVSNFLNFLLYANNFADSFSNYIVGALHPWGAKLFCDSATAVPYTSVSTGESTFDYYEITAHYKSLPFDTGSPAAIREDNVEMAGQWLSVPKRVYVGTSGPLYNTQEYATTWQSVYIPLLKVTSTLLGVQKVPLGAMIACNQHTSASDLVFKFGGTINNNGGVPIPITYTIPKDQILYCGGSSRRTVLSNGGIKYDVTHTFLISPVHNKYLDLSSPAADLLSMYKIPANGFVNYTPVDFSPLGV